MAPKGLMNVSRLYFRDKQQLVYHNIVVQPLRELRVQDYDWCQSSNQAWRLRGY